MSRASSDPARDVAFYHKLGCEQVESLRSPDGRHQMRTVTWEPPEDVELQFWHHPDSSTAGDFTVADFEKGVRIVHDSCISSYHCGFDQVRYFTVVVRRPRVAPPCDALRWGTRAGHNQRAHRTKAGGSGRGLRPEAPPREKRTE